MSGFTVGLAIIGGLVLAGLVAWNAWTTRRNTPRQPDVLTTMQPTVPMDGPAEPMPGATRAYTANTTASRERSMA